MKRRQRNNGRTYHIGVDRPHVIGVYNAEMGYVDRHNRFRQDILGLYRVWKTKSWQQRFITEFFGIALVDAFLLARKFVPRWMNASNKQSVFWAFANRLLPQLATYCDPDGIPEALAVSECQPRLQGKYTVAAGVHKGELRTKQQRCTYCKRATPKRTKKDGRATRTCYTCVAHPKIFMCKKSCWEEHLADVDCVSDSDAEVEGRDTFAYDRTRSPNLPTNRRITPPVTPATAASSSEDDMIPAPANASSSVRDDYYLNEWNRATARSKRPASRSPPANKKAPRPRRSPRK